MRHSVIRVALTVTAVLGALSATAVAQTPSLTGPDPDMQLVLDALNGLRPRPLPELTPEEARAQPTAADAVNALLVQLGRDTSSAALIPGVTSDDRSIPGPGGDLPIRVFTPAGTGPFPLVVYYHGGGWVIANRVVYDAGARSIAAQAGAVVVSVDYRLAPEAKFPAQHEDALASYQYVLTHASEFNGDSARIAVAGESAGGNLAVATAVAARDAGLPVPVHVLSVYPIALGDTTTQSYLRNANARPLNRGAMSWFLHNTLNNPGEFQDPRITLPNANLSGLSPITIIAAEIDPLLDDGEALAAAIQRDGGTVVRQVYTGVTHEFFGMGAVVEKAKAAEQFAGERLKAAFGP